MPDHDTSHADVVIVGQGPVGLLSAILLGQLGYDVLNVERWPSPYPLPRAVTFDHEIARILGTVGIDADNDPAIDYYDRLYKLFNAEGEELEVIDWASKAADGWRNRYWFDQPTLEARLRSIADSLPTVTRVQGYEAVSLIDTGGIDGTSDTVTTTFQRTPLTNREPDDSPNRTTFTTTSAFVIGADGANSFVRQAIDVPTTDLNFHYDWVVIDVIEHSPVAYDPPHFQVCDPARPHTVVPAGPGRRRWEFMLLPGEDPQTFSEPAVVWELLRPFDITPENAELVRHVVWRFQARYADDWHRGRVALAGDAAHLMPPFAGEGMCAGLRDALSLSWRLDLVLSGKAPLELIDTYTAERRSHAAWFIEFSRRLGEAICVTDPTEAAERDRLMKAALEEQRPLGPTKPYDAALGPGVFNPEDKHAGLPAIQGSVAFGGRIGRFDNVVGRGWVILTDAAAAGEVSDQARRIIEAFGGRVITVGAADQNVAAVDVDGTYQEWFFETNTRHLVVRPDFYVAGTAATGEQLDFLMRLLADAAHLRLSVS